MIHQKYDDLISLGIDSGWNDLPVSYLAAGAACINNGAQLYQPNIDIKELAARAMHFTAAIRSAHAKPSC